MFGQENKEDRGDVQYEMTDKKDRALPSRRHNKEQLKEMRKNSEDVLFLILFFG